MSSVFKEFFLRDEIIIRIVKGTREMEEHRHLKLVSKTDHRQAVKQLNTTMLLMQCIGILAVVLGHADIGSGNIPTLLKPIFPYYSWHMPFFIFISGYFFNRERPVIKYILGKCRTLLIPGLVVNAICGVFSMTIWHLDLAAYGREITIRRLFITPFTTGYQFCINVSLWFVFALFTIEMFSCLVDRLARGKHDIAFTLITLIVSLMCCACCFYRYDQTRNQYLNAGLRFGFLLFFFWCGTLYHIHLEKYVKRWLNFKTAIVIFCGICLFYGITGHKTIYNTRDMNLTEISVQNGFWVPIVMSLLAITFFLCISYSLAPYIKDSQMLYWLGTNTKYVVYWHQLCFILFSFLIYMLYCLEILPEIKGFTFDGLYSNQYYVSANPYIATVNVVFAICAPIIICTSLKKICSKWRMLICGSAVVLFIIGYFYLVHLIIS